MDGLPSVRHAARSLKRDTGNQSAKTWIVSSHSSSEGKRGANNERGNSSKVLPRGKGHLRLRQYFHDRLDEARASRRCLLEMPSFFHGPYARCRQRWSHRALQAALCKEGLIAEMASKTGFYVPSFLIPRFRLNIIFLLYNIE